MNPPSALANRAARTPESTARRIVGRIGANPITWLRHQVEHTIDLSPETLAHIRGLFRKLRARAGHLSSLTDDVAEREYVRISYRLNFMRTQEKLCRMKVTDKGYYTTSKLLGIYAAATLKFKESKGQRRATQRPQKPVPTSRTAGSQESDHEPESGDSDDGETA